MPEIRIDCRGQTFFTSRITTAAYKRYCALMEKGNQLDQEQSLMLNVRMLQAVLPAAPCVEDVMNVDIEQFMVAVSTIHFIMLKIVLPAMAKLNSSDEVEQVKSLFDDYDRENGYEDAKESEIDLWQAQQINVDTVVDFAVNVLKTSFTAAMESDILELLDHIQYKLNEMQKEQR